MKQSYETGVRGEEAAACYLASQGMQCLAKRYKTKCGEIDLIMQQGQTIVFIEVKTRMTRAGSGSGLSAVDRVKQQRIIRSALLYLQKQGLMDQAVRFDVVEVSTQGVRHIPDAFGAGGSYFY